MVVARDGDVERALCEQRSDQLDCSAREQYENRTEHAQFVRSKIAQKTTHKTRVVSFPERFFFMYLFCFFRHSYIPERRRRRSSLRRRFASRPLSPGRRT